MAFLGGFDQLVPFWRVSASRHGWFLTIASLSLYNEDGVPMLLLAYPQAKREKTQTHKSPGPAKILLMLANPGCKDV